MAAIIVKSVVLITGATRGLGFELANTFLKNGHTVIATFRIAADAKKLIELKSSFKSRFFPVHHDVTQDNELSDLIYSLTKIGKLDIVINNAGISLNPRQQASNLDVRSMRTVINTNFLGPLKVIKSSLPLLKKSRSPMIANITSHMGIIKKNKEGGFYAYRMSKSALNRATQIGAIQYPNISWLLVHPGHLKTRMGGAGAPTSAAASADGIYKLISNLRGKTGNLGMFNWNGQPIDPD